MFKKFLFILFMLVYVCSFATHNRAGEITYTHISGLIYEVTVTTYTDVSSSTNADRPVLEISWGDSSPLDSINRTSQLILGAGIKQNIYIKQHTYTGANSSAYIISVTDPNRNFGSMNIPLSDNVVFYIQSELIINPFITDGSPNNSPTLSYPPIDNACIGKIFVHNPGAIEIDGDSLYYSISQSLGAGGSLIPSYQFPPASSSFTINSATGDLIWDSPINAGEYNVAILIEEYRNGQKLGSILRDLQITVVPNCLPPPIITGPIDTCIIAGDTLNINYDATGSYAVTLSSTGLPYLVSNPAIFQQTTTPATSTSANFYWETGCNHVRKTPYSVSIKAIDAGPFHLADFHTTTIKVIAPKPENLTATVQANQINLSWNQSTCSPITKYKIYRKLGASGWMPGVCETGIPASVGFQLIGTTNALSATTYSDNNNGSGLVIGEQYCYRVVACFPDGAESIASDEACEQLIKDVAVLTRVNVNTTSFSSGSIYVEWSKPTEHSTVQYPGPYRYLVYRGEQNTSNMLLVDSTASINDTNYTDTLLNTLDYEYFYRIDIYNLTGGARELMGKSTIASSVYLTLTPSDNQVTLSWDEDVPWANSDYIIYRQNPVTLSYDSINRTSNQTYIDKGLVNLTTYCYKIKSIGTYSLPGTISPIENFSQENCMQPLDNVVPCPPNLCVEVNCQLQQNRLYWVNQNPGCADDVLQYNIYKKDSLNGDYELVVNIPNGTDTSFLHDNILSTLGCYVITGIDSVGNESVFSDSVCIDNPNGACSGNTGCVTESNGVEDTACFVYRLPNTFTPGSDGKNDLFIPFPYRFVESVDMKVFNRWGKLVFETSDPNVLWNGFNMDSNKASLDGTYFYVCTVNEYCLKGTESRIIKGFLTLFNNGARSDQ